MPKLTQSQLDRFTNEGFLLIEKLPGMSEKMQVLELEFANVLDSLVVELLEKKELKQSYSDLPFGERITAIIKETGKTYSSHFDFSLPQKGIKHDTPMWHGPAVFDILTHDPLLDVVESIMGDEIYSNPVQHVRIKPPEDQLPVNPITGEKYWGSLVSQTPWHQDTGVINETADDSNILTVWTPVWDAPIESGCLQVKPQSHNFGLYQHCPSPTSGAGIPEQILNTNTAIPVPMKRGSVLLINKLTAHASLPNMSNHVRWSLDLRYNPIGEPTGRESFPGFVVRSTKNPSAILTDPVAWSDLWKDTRTRLALEQDPSYNRWDADDPMCA
jgi:hypothetical protein